MADKIFTGCKFTTKERVLEVYSSLFLSMPDTRNGSAVTSISIVSACRAKTFRRAELALSLSPAQTFFLDICMTMQNISIRKDIARKRKISLILFTRSNR